MKSKRLPLTAPGLKPKDSGQKSFKPWWRHPVLLAVCKWFLLPTLIYTVIFYGLQPQYWGNFTHGFYLDSGDGFQNVWNIWWVNQSVGHGHNPYFTTMLHWPEGVTLLPQTMNILNGLAGIPLMHL